MPILDALMIAISGFLVVFLMLCLLWMIIEAGEMADIIKKKGDEAILHDAEARSHFVEETCDVLMYLNDVLLCYGITPEEIAAAYRAKFERNMTRW